ncbi:MAG: ankyrin repeat domain-containing protein, partial [Coxiellaceae bacterium]|nr:ankyrin repeat domain-containing protein [Coxiellaceae bacterium]
VNKQLDDYKSVLAEIRDCARDADPVEATRFIVNQPLDHNGNTALHLLAYHYCPDDRPRASEAFIRYLYQNKADITQHNQHGRSATTMNNVHDHRNPVNDAIAALRPSQSEINRVFDSNDIQQFETFRGNYPDWYSFGVTNKSGEAFLRLFYIAAYGTPEFFKHVLEAFKQNANKPSLNVSNAASSSDETSLRLIHFAAQYNNVLMLEYLLGQGVSIETKNANGATPLNFAIAYGSKEAVNFLLEHGADVSVFNPNRPIYVDMLNNVPIYNSWVELISAANHSGSLDLSCLVKNPSFLLLEILEKETLLSRFAKQGKLQVFISALNALDNTSKPKLENGLKKLSPAHWDAVISAWLKNEKNCDEGEFSWIAVQSGFNKTSGKLLHYATVNNRVDVLEKLLEEGSYNSADPSALLPRAVRNTSYAVVSLLLDRGVKPDFNDLKLFAEYWDSSKPGAVDAFQRSLAICENNATLNSEQLVELVKAALANKADTNALINLLLELPDVNRDAFLLMVVKEHPERTDYADKLVKAGANVRWIDSDGNTLVHYAAARSLKMVNWLGCQGVPLDQRNNAGQAPADESPIMKKQLKAMFEYAVNGRAKPAILSRPWLNLAVTNNADDQNTFIHIAAAFLNIQVLRELKQLFQDDLKAWKAEVNRTEPSIKGRSPLVYAVATAPELQQRADTGNQREVVQFLIGEGADVTLECEIGSGRSTVPCSFLAFAVATKNQTLFDIFIHQNNTNPNQHFSWRPRENDKPAFEDYSLLQAAIFLGADAKIIQGLIAKGVDVSAQIDGVALPFMTLPDKKATNPLAQQYKELSDNLASDKNFGTTITKLKNSNATWLKVIDKKTGQTIIHRLAKAGKLAELQRLLTEFSAIVGPLLAQPDQGTDQRTPLHYAVKSKNKALVEWLCQQLGSNLNPQDADGNTPYHLAVGDVKDGEIMGVLLEKGADPNLTNNTDKRADEITSWHSENPAVNLKKKFLREIRLNELDKVKKLYTQAAAALVPNNDFDKVLAEAAKHGAFRVFWYLGEESIKKNDNDATVKKHINTTSIDDDHNGDTLLLRAMRDKGLDFFEWFFEHGADIDQANAIGTTPLWFMVHKGNHDAVKQLIERGADVSHQRFTNNFSALMTALNKRHDDIAETLLIAGADTAAWVTKQVWNDYYQNYKTQTYYAHNYATSNSLFVKKAGNILSFLKAYQYVLSDLDQMKTVPGHEALDSKYREQANAIPQKLGQQSIQTISPTARYTDVLLKDPYKGFMKIPAAEIEALSSVAKELEQGYKQERTALFKQLLAKPLETFFDQKNERLKLRENINTANQSRLPGFSALMQNYNNQVVSPIDRIRKSLHCSGAIINEGSVDSSKVTASDYFYVVQTVPTLQPIVEQLQQQYEAAIKAAFQSQRVAYAKLKDQIDQLVKLKEALPEDSSLWESKEGWFGGGPSLRERVTPVFETIEKLKALAEATDETAVPSVNEMSNNQRALSFFSERLGEAVEKLTKAVEQYQTSVQKAEEKAAEQKRKEDERQAKTALTEKTKRIERATDKINHQFDALNKLFNDSRCDIKTYWVTENAENWPKETYYSEELKTALNKAKAAYKTVYDLFLQQPNATLPLVKLDKKKAGSVADQCDAIEAASTQVTQEFPVLATLLQQAYAQHDQLQAKIAIENELRSELYTVVEAINATRSKIVEALKGDEPEEQYLKVLAPLREAVACQQTDFSTVIIKLESVVGADEASLREKIAVAKTANDSLKRYHERLDKVNFEAEQARQRKVTLCKEVNRQAQSINNVLTTVSTLLANKSADTASLISLNAYRQVLGCDGVDTVAAVTVNTAELESSDEAQLRVIQAKGAAAKSGIDEYKRQLETQDKAEKAAAEKKAKEEAEAKAAQEKAAAAKAKTEQQLRDKFNQRLTYLNHLLSETTGALTGAVDSDALTAVTDFRSVMSSTGNDLEAIQKPNDFATWDEAATTSKQDLIETAIKSAEAYKKIVLANNKAAQEKSKREDQKGQEIRTEVGFINRELTALRELKGNDNFADTCSAASEEVRSTLLDTNRGVLDITIGEGLLLEKDEAALDAILQQLKAVKQAAVADQATLRERNYQGFHAVVGEALKAFHQALSSLKTAGENNTLHVYSVASDIDKVAKQIGKSHKYQSYEPIELDNEKLQGLPINEHQAIAVSLNAITEKLNGITKTLNEKRSQEEIAAHEKASALTALEDAVKQLNAAAERLNQSVAGQRGKIPDALSLEMDKTWRHELEAPAGFSLFSSSKYSDASHLETVKFSREHNKHYETAALIHKAEAIKVFADQLQSEVEQIVKVQTLQAQLVTYKEQMQERMAKLSSEDVAAEQAFITGTLEPESRELRSSSDIPKLEATGKKAEKHITALQEKLAAQQQRRQATAEKVKAAIATLNTSIAALGQQVGQGVEENFGAMKAFVQVRSVLGDQVDQAFKQITISPEILNRDISEDAVLAVIATAQGRVPEVQAAINEKKEALLAEMKKQRAKTRAAVKETEESKQERYGDRLKVLSKAAGEAPSIGELILIKADQDLLEGQVKAAEVVKPTQTKPKAAAKQSVKKSGGGTSSVTGGSSKKAVAKSKAKATSAAGTTASNVVSTITPPVRKSSTSTSTTVASSKQSVTSVFASVPTEVADLLPPVDHSGSSEEATQSVEALQEECRRVKEVAYSALNGAVKNGDPLAKQYQALITRERENSNDIAVLKEVIAAFKQIPLDLEAVRDDCARAYQEAKAIFNDQPDESDSVTEKYHQLVKAKERAATVTEQRDLTAQVNTLLAQAQKSKTTTTTTTTTTTSAVGAVPKPHGYPKPKTAATTFMQGSIQGEDGEFVPVSQTASSDSESDSSDNDSDSESDAPSLPTPTHEKQSSLVVRRRKTTKEKEEKAQAREERQEKKAAVKEKARARELRKEQKQKAKEEKDKAREQRREQRRRQKEAEKAEKKAEAKEAEALRSVKESNQELLDILTLFKSDVLDPMRYSVRFHYEEYANCKDLTKIEKYHMVKLLTVLDQMNVYVKADIERIEKLTEKEAGYACIIKRVRDDAKWIEATLSEISRNGTTDRYAQYNLSLVDDESEKMVLKCRERALFNILDSRRNLAVTGKYLSIIHWIVGPYRDFHEVLRALAERMDIALQDQEQHAKIEYQNVNTPTKKTGIFSRLADYEEKRQGLSNVSEKRRGGPSLFSSSQRANVHGRPVRTSESKSKAPAKPPAPQYSQVSLTTTTTTSPTQTMTPPRVTSSPKELMQKHLDLINAELQKVREKRTILKPLLNEMDPPLESRDIKQLNQLRQLVGCKNSGVDDIVIHNEKFS